MTSTGGRLSPYTIARFKLLGLGGAILAQIGRIWRQIARVAERTIPPRIRNAQLLQNPVVLGFLVAALHVVVVLVLLISLQSARAPKAPAEITITLNTSIPSPVRGAPAPPNLAPPASADLQPPDITIENPAPAASLAIPVSGGSGATMPAEAISEAHTVPPLSETLLTLARKTLIRLRLSIAEDGGISDAVVDSSSGSAEVDRIAVAWVKAHWRYKPAMRNGLAIPVTTTALVPF